MSACAHSVRTGDISVTEIANWTLGEIDRLDIDLRAFTFVDREAVIAQASSLDQRIARGERIGPLVGATLGVKDLFNVKGLPTSAGSEAFDPFFPAADAPSVARLRQAGAVVIGKTRTSEFAWSTTTPPTANPMDVRLISGGSSGGSGAAVGAGLVHAALGTDVGGSIRIPAALCGVVGIKPTYGLVSMSGVLPGHWSFDTAGPLTRSVADARLLLGLMMGHDSEYPGSASAARIESLRKRLRNPSRPISLRGSRLGVIDEPLFEILEERAREVHDRLLSRLLEQGAVLVRVKLPETEYVPPVMYAIDPEGAAAHTQRLRDRSRDFGDEARKLIHFAQIIPGVLVMRAYQVRRQLSRIVAELFERERLEALVLPANTAPAIPSSDLNLAFRRANGESELAVSSYARVFWLASVTGQPSLVLPAVADAPPIGVQLMGRPFEDDSLLDLGAGFERILPL
jgi:aspartyl-tRNA(Asn)/glutamyl-tRNA(Gln) amidotransferase subunit A